MLKGCNAVQYDEEKGNEAFADDFQQAMTYFTKLSLRGGEVSLKDAFNWSQSRCVMDVGGGRGECLSHCMLHAGPQCRGVLMDRPWVLDRCKAALHRRARNLKPSVESRLFLDSDINWHHNSLGAYFALYGQCIVL